MYKVRFGLDKARANFIVPISRLCPSPFCIPSGGTVKSLSLTNAYISLSIFARHGPLSQVRSHISRLGGIS